MPMTTLRSLYELQEHDIEIAKITTGVSAIEREIGDRTGLDALAKEVENRKARLDEVRSGHRSEELDAESVREKVKDIEAKLYGGSITNPREVASYQKEVTLLKEQLQKKDDQLLEVMVTVEEENAGFKSAEHLYLQAEEEWDKRQKQLAEELSGLQETHKSLQTRRKSAVSKVGEQELRLYDRLRASKGGVAVAKVERGLCHVCRMSLPSYELQRARAGRETVLCSSCGRILYVI